MLFATPLRNGKVLLFYNRDENMIQFSKNKSKRANEDDYGLYSKDTLRLAESERLLEVKWIMGAETYFWALTQSRARYANKPVACVRRYAFDDHNWQP